ncbi:methylenetetrahydrofolate dehydrogenase (NADP+) / methenyltetrahydrofolate cyclohydrolase [Desulfurobacterium pacificum]|uniref:Bifunctional protein FolD n=1 Tax=Desulfurobacterium pacificum TaxID=240166 RepID=A0ABY1N7F1_9BACT|nr:bifunctional methylenetetrahydrofolate dehydrogenase/methenyltetrahydrofolate cyclohydrolase FolD [Desulfurobacterium pacificum]SMP02418.1 methylenetetrahydrofolate dehydrogenase (NADP+) / methenyltetrahydrofolate cyclohydrolase [Desulfurobacterium pacificum]
MAVILDGKKLSEKIKKELKEEVENLKKQGLREPALAVVLVGNDPASEIYVRNKIKSCQAVGIRSVDVKLPEDITQEKLNDIVKELNEDEGIDGIIVQLPLPEHLSCREVIEYISPEKDVDGFHPENAGKCLLGLYEKGLMPCTPAGVMKIFEEYGIELQGKNAVMVGHSNIVGKPLANMMINANATVSVCHVYTKDLASFTKEADILCVATGVPHLIKADMVKEGAVVIDIGISRVNGKIVGDVDFENVKEKAYAITPVPGGVGPMTIAMLLYNTVKAYKMRMNI